MQAMLLRANAHSVATPHPMRMTDRPTYRHLGWGFGLNFKNRTQLKMG